MKGLERKSKNLVKRDGTYYFRKTINGKRRMISTEIKVGGAPEFALAEKRARQIENEINEGRFGFGKKPEQKASTVEAWCKRHLAAQLSQIAEGTQVSLRVTARHLCETSIGGVTWADRDIRTITETDCRAMLTAMQFGTLKSVNTRRTFHAVAGGIFEAARREGLLEQNPWRQFKRVKGKPRERVLTTAEEELVRPFLDAYYQRVLVLELLAGLRVGCELSALKIDKVDFPRQQVEITGKGGKKRFVPLAAEAATAIREQQALNIMGRPGAVKVTPRMRRRIEQGYVFPVCERTVLRAWHVAADSAKIERFTSHDLRRTYGTRCAEAGVPMKRLQLWMGHSDIGITAQFYVHLDRENDAVWINRVAAEQKPKETEGTGVATVDLKVVKS